MNAIKVSTSKYLDYEEREYRSCVGMRRVLYGHIGHTGGDEPNPSQENADRIREDNTK